MTCMGLANVRASLGFEVVRTVSVFDQVEMRVADRVAQYWPARHVREHP